MKNTNKNLKNFKTVNAVCGICGDNIVNSVIIFGNKEYTMKGNCSCSRIDQEQFKPSKSANIPQRYKKFKSLDNLIITQNNKSTIDLLFKYKNNFSYKNNKSILLTSKGVGTGKTTMSCALLNNLIDIGFSGLFYVIPELLEAVKTTYSSNNMNESKIIKRIFSCDCLVLDDLGTEKTTEWTKEFLFKIINNRYNNKKAIIFTTNLDIKELYSKFGERMMSRIQEESYIYKVEDTDWRAKR